MLLEEPLLAIFAFCVLFLLPFLGDSSSSDIFRVEALLRFDMTCVCSCTQARKKKKINFLERFEAFPALLPEDKVAGQGKEGGSVRKDV